MSFENASVTKALIIGYGLSSILVGLFDVKHYFHLQFVPHLSRHHQYWRLALHHLAFSNSSDLFVAELVLYNVGVQIERQFGTLKFASFVVVSTIVATILELLSLIFFHNSGLNHIAMGPAALLFSLLYQYSRIVPSAYNYRIFGLPLTNKSLVYLLALQTAISRPPGSIAVAIIGILSGQIYRSDLANLKAYRVSPAVVRFSTRFILPLIGSLRPPRRSNRALPDETRTSSSLTSSVVHNEEVITTARTQPPSAAGGARTRHRDLRAQISENAGVDTGTGSVVREWMDELTGRAERNATGIRVPSEDEIVQLTTMFPDFQRDVVVAALQRSSTIEAAVEILLNSQS